MDGQATDERTVADNQSIQPTASRLRLMPVVGERMNITNCTVDDFLEIHQRFAEFWPSADETFLRRIKTVHHPIFVHEFGNTSYVMKKDGKIVAYLFCAFSQTEPTGYIHALCVHPSHRRKGLARQLCERFIADARAHGCTHLKSAPSPGNATSIAFHKSLGMELTGDTEKDGVRYFRDYSGPGEDRVVFKKEI